MLPMENRLFKLYLCFGCSLSFYLPFVVFATIRKLNLLSFGEEAEEEEKELAAVKHKIKSSHDVLNDPRLLKPESTNKERVIIQFYLLFFAALMYSSLLCESIANNYITYPPGCYM